MSMQTDGFGFCRLLERGWTRAEGREPDTVTGGIIGYFNAVFPTNPSGLGIGLASLGIPAKDW